MSLLQNLPATKNPSILIVGRTKSSRPSQSDELAPVFQDLSKRIHGDSPPNQTK